MEVTFDQSKPERLAQTSDTVKLLREQMGDKMAIGAGTVTSLEMLELAQDAGARFIVSPDTNEEVIKATAVNMNRNKNYPSIQKLRIIDDVLGTCIKDFT